MDGVERRGIEGGGERRDDGGVGSIGGEEGRDRGGKGEAEVQRGGRDVRRAGLRWG